MKIVKFKDGTFAIRRKFLGVLWYQYRHLFACYWLRTSDECFYRCKGDYGTVKKQYDLLNDFGEVVNEN